MSDYQIGEMKREELELMIEWAANEGWNPGLHDAQSYFAADPHGFLIGRLAGEPIAALSAVKYGNAFGFLGLYLVHPNYRGRGYGIRIWNAGLRHLSGRNIGLDGVVDQQENYRKSGFQFAYRNVRMEGRGGGDYPDCRAIVNLLTLPFEEILAYERPFFPEPRAEFLRAWIQQSGGHALGIQEAGKLVGYGVLRPCRVGYKIGPLFADSPEIAVTLFQALKSKTGGNVPVFLDVPEVNSAGLALAEAGNMKVVFETARMYSRGIPDLPLKNIYGVTSFEVG